MRRVIKRVLSIAIAVTVTAGVCLTSYAGWWNSGNSATTAAAAATATTETFSFVSGTTTINVGDKAQDIIKALGQCKSVYEVPSCAYQGNDKIYAYLMGNISLMILRAMAWDRLLSLLPGKTLLQEIR